MTCLDIGSRLELFVDRLMVDRLGGGARLFQHKPRPENVVLSDDQPWESSIGYFSVLFDRGLYRMYYRGYHHGKGEQALGEPMCYAESRDGVAWTKPALGLFRFEGSAENNIVLGGDLAKFPATEKWRGQLGRDIRWRGDFVPFVDTRPGVKEDARYKALIRGCRGFHQIESRRSDYGMYPFQSPDGINWTLLSDKPVITRGRFDSQNLAFWDAVYGRYVAFARDVRGKEQTPGAGDAEDVGAGLVRDIRVCFSDDFVHWSDPEFVEYPGAPREHLYTNAVMPYERAPHLLLGFPTRFLPQGSQTEPVLMASRDGGRAFHRWPEALIPRDAPQERDGNRSNYMAHGLVPGGGGRELFAYATEGYKDGPSRRLRRFVWRVDGFVSVRAGAGGGEVVTPVLAFQGGGLVLNYAAAPGGWVRVEMQDADGGPLEGFSLDQCEPLHGDEIEGRVAWRQGASPGRWAGQPVRLRFALKDADLFSFQFRD